MQNNWTQTLFCWFGKREQSGLEVPCILQLLSLHDQAVNDENL